MQLRASEAGTKPTARHDDGFDLCLAKARLVMIGLEERARATARHLPSCKIEKPQCGLPLSVDRPKGGGLCRFWRFRSRAIAVATGLQAADAALSRAIHRTASGRQQKSGPIPRTRNPRLSR